jgi:hypothetical protein
MAKATRVVRTDLKDLMGPQFDGSIFELGLPALEKLGYIVIDDHVKKHGELPDVDTLAKKSSMSRHGAKRVLDNFERLGIIQSGALKGLMGLKQK